MNSPSVITTGAAASELAALVVPGSRIALTTHVNPDGDGLGSEAALARMMLDQGVDVAIANPNPTPERFAFLFEDLPGIDRSAKAAESLKRADAIFVLDIGDVGRLGGLAELVRNVTVPVACIDHHVGPGELPEGPRMIDPTAAATGELVYSLAAAAGWEVTPAAARALYVALLTDTGSFRFSNTSPRALRVCADLLELGVDPEDVYRQVYAGGPAGRPRLLAEVLQTLVVEEEYGLAWVTVPPGALERHGVDADDLDGVVEHARAIRGVRLALLFRDIAGGRVKVSFRSVAGVDVARLAATFGGGGHHRASGAAVAGSMAAVQEAVLAASRDFLRSVA